MTDDPESNKRNQKVRERAYEIWESEGRPAGQHQEHWHRARRELDDPANDGPVPAPAEDVLTGSTPPIAKGKPAAPAAAKRPRKPRAVKPKAV